MTLEPTRSMLIALTTLVSVASAEDRFFYLPLNDVEVVQGQMPGWPTQHRANRWRRSAATQPYARLKGPGETYLGPAAGDDGGARDWRAPVSLYLAVRAPEGAVVEGTLYWPRLGNREARRVRFRVPAVKASTVAEEEFLLAKQRYYTQLWQQDAPGAAWFRHQARATATRSGQAVPDLTTRPNVRGRRSPSGMEGTFAMFTGGRAISENLQLDRVLGVGRSDTLEIDVADLAGITVREVDWNSLLDEAETELDPLAAMIPADQHAFFFPSFAAMTRMLDEAEVHGAPVLQALEPQARNARTSQRYQRQLCLQLDDLARVVGPHLISSMAMTGSDPYLRTGSDVAILFETSQPRTLMKLIAASQTIAATARMETERLDVEIGGASFQGVVSTDRTLSSYLGRLGEVVVVANSEAQLRRIVTTAEGDQPALAALEEYRFFRQKYPRQNPEETAFLILTDGAIRRWCGPRWRIAASRRTRAAAVMAEMQARHLSSLVHGMVEAEVLVPEYTVPEAGEWRINGSGVSSSVYGDLNFQTPILELPLDKVTSAEATAYRRYRDRYQRNWRQYFDPIAIRFEVSEARMAADVTVLPLIGGTEYQGFVQAASGAELGSASGDPHPEAIVEWVMALNPDSEPVRRIGSLVSVIGSGRGFDPLGWLDNSLAVYVDRDPLWHAAATAEDPEGYLRDHQARVPVAITVGVRSPLRLAAFLTALRAFAQQSAPGGMVWDVLTHREVDYVRVTPAGSLRSAATEEFALYYLVRPDAFTLSLSEAIIQRAIARHLDRADEKATERRDIEQTTPWLGKHMGLRVKGDFLEALQRLTANGLQENLRRLSWNNLPILNEWKQRYPDRDPVTLHQTFWQLRLVCPGGGKYVWNPEWRTMESTVFGHPAAPKLPDHGRHPLARFRTANLGLTFEHGGLSARAVVERQGESSE